ncbi:MAG: DUF2062 domain-containing protein [Lentisphaerae bacterium]|nr:DUF2062 domain-containing protein [Lentisphaerota bacterium]
MQSNNAITSEPHTGIPDDSVWCVIASYSTSDALSKTIAQCLASHLKVVVNAPINHVAAEILRNDMVHFLNEIGTHSRGSVIMAAAEYARSNGAAYLLTLNANGKAPVLAEDLESLIKDIEKNGNMIVIGHRSEHVKSASDLIVRMETGANVDDPACVLRIYPLEYLCKLRLNQSSPCFELEALIKLLWAGLRAKSVPLSGRYNLSTDGHPALACTIFLHLRFLARQMLPFPHRRLVRRQFDIMRLLRHPRQFIAALLTEHATPGGLAVSSAVGVFLGTIPLLFCHTAAIIYVTTRLNLNKIMAIAIQHICLPPFVPVLCVEVGYYLRYGRWLTEISINTVIAQLHHRIFEWFLGSLVVAPLLSTLVAIVVFALAKISAQHTNKKLRGNRLGFWFFRTFVRMFGLRSAYALLYIVCVYYLLFDRAAVRAASAYIRRSFPGQNRLQRTVHIYRLFASQGKNLIDRYYMISGGNMDIQFNGYDMISDLLSSGKGIVLLTSHVGNWQIAMPAIEKFQKPVSLLMRPEDNPAVEQSLGMRTNMFKIISPDRFLGGVVEMMNMIAKGHIVSIMGDRNYGSDSVQVMFLGEKAQFPHGAFTIAAGADCPIVILLSARTGYRRYRIDVAAVLRHKYLPGLPKRNQLQEWVQEYANTIEHYIRQYPYQCFLFHDIWSEANDKKLSRTG